MRLVTFKTAEGERRIGTLTADNQVVDLSTAAALYLRDVEKEGAYYRIAQARLPNDMRGLFEGGAQSLALARNAFEYDQEIGARAKWPPREAVLRPRGSIKVRPPIVPTKFFNTACNFREKHVEAHRAGFS